MNSEWNQVNVCALVVVGAIVAFKWSSLQPKVDPTAAAAAPVANVPAGTTGLPAAQPVAGQPVAPAVGQAVAATNAVAEEGYLIIQNPLGGDGMVRVMDGFTQKARVLAWTNPGDKYRIRAQSPTKMRRTYLKDGKNVTYEDFFYKISDKEQWVFGFFTTKKLAQ